MAMGGQSTWKSAKPRCTERMNGGDHLTPALAHLSKALSEESALV